MHTVITGGSSGIGAALAQRFARRGRNLVLVARGETRLEQTKEALSTYNVDIQTVSVDLSHPESAENLIEELDRRGIRVECLVNNAGFGLRGSFKDLSLEKQQGMTVLNAYTPMTLTHHYLNQGVQEVINIASTAAYSPGPYMATYFATKWYLYAWSTAVNKEVEAHVLTVCPGPTKTGFAARAHTEDMDAFKQGSSASSVAAGVIQALDKEDAVYIHGFTNKVLAGIAKLLPSSVTARFVASGFKQET
jgi:hypothetical protein